MPLDSRWLRHLDGTDAEKFRQALENDTLVLGRLLAILEEEEAAINRTEMSENSFDNPNWAYKQAYLNGERSRLRKTIALLQFLKD